jgi:hypothetical protein
MCGLDYACASRPETDPITAYFDCFSPTPGEIAFIVGEFNDAMNVPLGARALILHYFRCAVSMGVFAPRELALDLSDMVRMTCEADCTASCFCGYYSRRTGVLRYSNAGHPAPLLLKVQSGEVVALGRARRFSQYARRPAYLEGHIHLDAGDRLIAFTGVAADCWAVRRDPDGGTALPNLLRSWRHETAADLAAFILDDPPAEVVRQCRRDRVVMAFLRDGSNSSTSFASREELMPAAV